ncbi:hypothetical protein JQS43_15515 [Natronosporangium hydrolyticum]|uniref:Uncharacterized protein n=1 Tax=Natronosporangium hydrolyticum TaxID=2811111 RepID=A0A895Y9R8_9ACTN|nr:hypothetical protein [Natronosporangium hydrolyticum]QSB13055.1 hypothetical protein JQS43_15515 [Natronosporangium hydrolyticum]
MSTSHHHDSGRSAEDDVPEQAPEQVEPAAEPPPLGGDFAEEHSEVTFADQDAGGPEGEKEPEAPSGYAGMESRGVAKRKPKGQR